MKKYGIYILFALAAVLSTALASCSETTDEDTEFADWQNRNEQYFDQKYNEVKALADAGNADWKILRGYTLESNVATHSYDHILINVLKQGDGDGCPLYTDYVEVHYSGRLMPTESYKNGYEFDKSWTGDFYEATALPAKLAVNGVVEGFGTALQHMHIGDKWRVYIPYQLGYGNQASGSVPAYSTLVFDIELVHYYRANYSKNAVKARSARH